LTLQTECSPCLPELAAAFEQLLQTIEPALATHLTALGCPPLSLGLPWIVRAFVTVLPVQEVLQLWDRVIGFDTLLILPVAAVAILAWRSQLLQSCQSAEDVALVLGQLNELQIVPLLQAVLFLTSTREG
jgi:multisubunit Na+/H+ antiporter MnhF subunit